GEDEQKLKNKWVLTLTKEVPNDDGILTITLKGGRKLSLPIRHVGQMPLMGKGKGGEQGPGLGVPIKMLYTQFSDNLIPPAQLMQLIGAPVQFFSQNFPNVNPRPGNSNQKIEDSLESIRLLLTRPNTLNP